MRHVSTGDLFREAIKRRSPLGLEAKTLMDSGKLVPDSVVIGMVEEVLSSLNGQEFILDGFPRSIVQAEALDGLLKDHGFRLDRALFIEVPTGNLLSRLSGRRVCGSCGAVFHIVSSPPRLNGTWPLKDYFSGKGKLREVNGVGTTEEVFGRILAEMS